MAKLPVYQQRYQVGTRRASAEDFGAAEGRAQAQFGQAVAGLGDTLAVIEDRRQTRKETIERVRDKNKMVRLSEQKMTELQTERDMTDTTLPNEYAQFLEDTVNEIVENHPGRDISRDALKADLLSIKQQYSSNLYKQSVEAGYKVIKTELDNAIKGFADSAADNPLQMEAMFDAVDMTVDDMAPALPEGVEQEYKTKGYSEIIDSVVTGYINAGEYDAALSVLNDEKVVKSLTPEKMRQLKTSAISNKSTIETAARKETAKLNAKMNWLKNQGFPVDENTAARMVGAMGTTLTPAEQLGNLADVGIELTPEQQLQYLKIEKMDPKRTPSEIEARREYLLRNADAYASGSLTPDEMSRYDAEIIAYKEDYVVGKNAAGDQTYMPRQLPPKVAWAEQQSGRAGLSTTLELQQQKIQKQMEEDRIVREAPMASGTVDQGGVYMMADMIAGVPGAWDNLIATAPIIGQNFTEAQASAQAQADAKFIQQRLIQALSFNKKFPVRLVEMINEEFAITNSLYDNSKAYRGRLESIDKNLESRTKELDKQINSPFTKKADLAELRRARSDIETYRRMVPVPRVTVNSIEEARKLPVGTLFKFQGQGPGEFEVRPVLPDER